MIYNDNPFDGQSRPTPGYLRLLLKTVQDLTQQVRLFGGTSPIVSPFDAPLSPLERELYSRKVGELEVKKAEIRRHLAAGYPFPNDVYPFTFEGKNYTSPNTPSLIQQPAETSPVPLPSEEIPPVRKPRQPANRREHGGLILEYMIEQGEPPRRK